jgi:hypothetical protein
MKKVMKKFTDINLAVNNLVAAANADYTDRSNYNYEDKTDVQKKIKNEMDDKFVNGWTITKGSKYIRFRTADYGTWGFVVNTDNDKLFKKGDLLKPAGYDKPARNAARGNILDGGFQINWTGPLYL